MALRRVTSLEYRKDEKGDLVADSHTILARWRNHVRQTDIHTAQPLVPEPSALKLSWLLKS